MSVNSTVNNMMEKKDGLESVTERLPGLLGRELSTKLVVVDDVDVRFVGLKLLDSVGRLLLLSHALLVLQCRLVLVASSSLDPLELPLGQSTSSIGEPEVLLLLDPLAFFCVRGRRLVEVTSRPKQGQSSGETLSDDGFSGGAHLQIE